MAGCFFVVGDGVALRRSIWRMPTYCYRDDAGQLVEITMTVAEMVRREFDGVIEHDGRLLTRDLSAEHAPRTGNAFCGARWPMLSDAAGVHPSEIEAATADMRKRGVNLGFAPDGRAVFESAAHRRQSLRALGMHDRAGYD